MSEYWKSTPTYWCKHCKTYVRDTKFERQNHEATGKHQGNLKRFLRDLHRNHEQEEREKDRAKQEVARLNGIVSGAGQVAGPSSRSSSSAITSRSAPKPATVAQRKEQLAQLAELGVSIPDELRGGMAMAGDWQVTAERIIEPGHDGQKSDAVSIGVHKRLATREEDEEEEPGMKKRKWGSAYKTHPVTDTNLDDLDALLSKPIATAAPVKTETEVKQETEPMIKQEITNEPVDDLPPKQESPDGSFERRLPESDPSELAPIKQEEDGSAVVFKKRKAKNIRQK